MTEIKINLSSKSIFKIIVVLVSLYLFYLISDIVLLLFVSIIFASLIDPFATWLEKKKIPRFLAVLIIYLVLLSILVLSIFLIGPLLVHDLPKMMENLSNFWSGMQSNPFWQSVLNNIEQVQNFLSNYFESGSSSFSGTSSSVGGAVSGVFQTIFGFFGGVFSLLIVLVMTFYMVAQEDAIKKISNSILPEKYLPRVEAIVKKLRNKLGMWLRGQLLLSFIIGTLVFVVLLIFNVKYAALLALLAGLLEFVPYVGPIFASIPALLLAFSAGGFLKMFFVALAYIVIQQL